MSFFIVPLVLTFVVGIVSLVVYVMTKVFQVPIWKITLFIMFIMFYMTGSTIAFYKDWSSGEAEFSDFPSYVKFSRFKEYSDEFDRELNYLKGSESGVSKFNALGSMLWLSIAQLAFLGAIAMFMWIIIPSDSLFVGFLTFLLASVLVIIFGRMAYGDWYPAIFKPLVWMVKLAWHKPAVVPVNETINTTINDTITYAKGGV